MSSSDSCPMSSVSASITKEIKPTLCRVCLRDGEKFMSIFEQLGCLQVYEHIMSVAMVNIMIDDGLPDLVCPACLLQLQEAINFKAKCEESDRFLKNPLALKNLANIKDDPQELTSNIKKEDETLTDTPEYLESLDDNECEHEPTPHIPNPARGQQFSPQCNECKQYFRSKCKLRVHWKKEHVNVQLLCIICKRMFKSRLALKNHKINSPQSCTELLKNSDKVAVIGQGKSRMFQCKQCDYKATTYKHVDQHIIVHNPGYKPFKCKLCPCAYTQLGTLKSHIMEQHDTTNKFPCHICGKVELSMRYFRNHMRKHRVASFACPTCNKLFKTKDIVKQHMRRHSGIKTYTCETCPKAFFTSADLSTHRRTQHNTIFKCSVCDFQNKHKNYMDKHQVQHGGDKPNPCIKCGKFYSTVHDLQLHLRKFHNPKHFECPICNNTYGTKNSAAWHMAKKHGSKPPYNIKTAASLKSAPQNTKAESAGESSDEVS